MATLRKQPKSELDQLRAQRQELAGRLAKAETRAANMDPLNDWENLSQLTSEIQSLERAIATADQRIEAAERAAAAAAVAERDAERSERALAARINLEAVARQVCDELQRLDAGLLADLDAAGRELAAVGGFPSSQIGPALEVRQAVRLSLERWRGLAPVWVGLPEPLTRVELARREEEARLSQMEAQLAEWKRLGNKDRYDAGHGATNVQDRVSDLVKLVASSRERLAALV